MLNRFPLYIDIPRTWVAQVSASNSNLNGTGTLVDVVTPGANGSRIDFIEIKAAVTTTAGMVRLFIYNGSTTRLIKEIAVTATTASAAVPAYSTTWTPVSPLSLLSTETLKASTENGEAINIVAYGGDY